MRRGPMGISAFGHHVKHFKMKHFVISKISNFSQELEIQTSHSQVFLGTTRVECKTAL